MFDRVSGPTGLLLCDFFAAEGAEVLSTARHPAIYGDWLHAGGALTAGELQREPAARA